MNTHTDIPPRREPFLRGGAAIPRPGSRRNAPSGRKRRPGARSWIARTAHEPCHPARATGRGGRGGRASARAKATSRRTPFESALLFIHHLNTTTR